MARAASSMQPTMVSRPAARATELICMASAMPPTQCSSGSVSSRQASTRDSIGIAALDRPWRFKLVELKPDTLMGPDPDAADEPEFCQVPANRPFDRGEKAEQMVTATISAIEAGSGGEFGFDVTNCDRSIGARLSGEIARRYGNLGMAGDPIAIRWLKRFIVDQIPETIISPGTIPLNESEVAAKQEQFQYREHIVGIDILLIIACRAALAQKVTLIIITSVIS